jgi:GTP-binding protein
MAYNAEELERGKHLFAQNCEFIRGSTAMENLPASELPEVAIAGRSNVGKSSLVNLLTGRKALARVSKTPGRTRELNFFRAGSQLMLVDLPGYGYARVSREDSDRWTDLVFAYLRGRPNLRRAFLLIDSRHGPLENDAAVMELLDRAAVSFQIVMTKSDKPGKAELVRSRGETEAELRKHPAALSDIIVTSAHSGEGVGELRAALAALTIR